MGQTHRCGVVSGRPGGPRKIGKIGKIVLYAAGIRVKVEVEGMTSSQFLLLVSPARLLLIYSFMFKFGFSVMSIGS